MYTNLIYIRGHWSNESEMAFCEIGWQKGEISPSCGTFNVTQADEGEFKLFANKWQSGQPS